MYRCTSHTENFSIPFNVLRYTNRSFWVGSSDLETEGVFRWFYSGEKLSQDLWSTGQPDNSNGTVGYYTALKLYKAII